jgi:hypothetical protein
LNSLHYLSCGDITIGVASWIPQSKSKDQPRPTIDRFPFGGETSSYIPFHCAYCKCSSVPYSPFIQNLLISACLFAGPGLYLAITVSLLPVVLHGSSRLTVLLLDRGSEQVVANPLLSPLQTLVMESSMGFLPCPQWLLDLY